jgi:hypothetical protein
MWEGARWPHFLHKYIYLRPLLCDGKFRPSVVLHTSNPSAQETEAGQSQF